jgi:glycosyltransferase involved in cell wall biosynthesis
MILEPSGRSGLVTAPDPRGIALTIAVPAYNEAENVEFVVARARECAAAMPSSVEILLVDDGSSDETGTIADRLASEHRELRVVHHGKNRGFGGAIASCLREARGEWVFLGPADGQIDLADACRFYNARADADIVIGIRERRSDPFYRKVLSWGFHTLANGLLGLPYSEFSSCFLFRRDSVAGFELKSRPDAATILPEILFRAHRAGLRAIELPVAHYVRRAGQPKGAQPKVIVKSLWGLVRLAFELRRAK